MDTGGRIINSSTRNIFTMDGKATSRDVTLLYVILFRNLSFPFNHLLISAAPVNNLVEYETRTFYRSRGENKSPFQGWPNDEKDKLWQDSYYREDDSLLREKLQNPRPTS